MSRRLGSHQVVIVLSGLLVVIAQYLAFIVALLEAVMGNLQRIFYFHVASSWTGYLALFVTFVSGILYLRSRAHTWDLLGHSSAEIGWMFITGGILTGSIWAKTTWGVWWTWDPRLTTSAVLWLAYASYLILRQAMDSPSLRARVGAVYGIVAFVSVPMNFMAIRWWRAAHPLVLESSGSGLSRSMVRVLLFCVFAFTVFYVALLSMRFRLGRASEDLRAIRRR